MVRRFFPRCHQPSSARMTPLAAFEFFDATFNLNRRKTDQRIFIRPERPNATALVVHQHEGVVGRRRPERGREVRLCRVQIGMAVAEECGGVSAHSRDPSGQIANEPSVTWHEKLGGTTVWPRLLVPAVRSRTTSTGSNQRAWGVRLSDSSSSLHRGEGDWQSKGAGPASDYMSSACGFLKTSRPSQNQAQPANAPSGTVIGAVITRPTTRTDSSRARGR